MPIQGIKSIIILKIRIRDNDRQTDRQTDAKHVILNLFQDLISERPCDPEINSGRRVTLGFTIAEVLITLGIIGIVAAITIPLLKNKSNDVELKAAFKKNYSTLMNGLNSVTQDNGGYYYNCYYGGNECGVFWTALKSKLKVAKTATNVFLSQVYTGWDSANFSGTKLNPSCNGGNTSNLNGKDVLYLADGSTLISYTDHFVSSHYFFLDVNGFKKPNKWGYDIFSINWGKNGVLTDNICGVYETGGHRIQDILLK